MSYLDRVRLHFSGQFQADPSTVNNDPTHYDNATFLPEYQLPQTDTSANGWWNPDGSASWRLVDCHVTRVCYVDGSSTNDVAADPVVGMRIMDANKRVAGKLVDLDPQQQMVSQIWGLLVRLTDGVNDAFSGPFERASFSDLWMRSAPVGTKMPLGVFYQSVLAPVLWGDDRKSRFLRELRAAAKHDMLSIKFNLDGYDSDSTSATFTLGRIVGTIGPADDDEPRQFVLGRHLGGTTRLMTFMPCVVDKKARRILADFGNSLPTVAPGGNLAPVLGALTLGYLDASKTFQSLGDVPYQTPNFYESTAGIVELPADRDLTNDELKALASNPVAVASNGKTLLQENIDGLYVRADNFTYRLSPGDTAEVELWATQYGELQDGARINVSFDPTGLQQSNGPAVATPTTALTGFAASTPIVAKKGRATLKLTAHDPDNPRGYIDGQVYGVRPIPQAVVGNPPGSWVDPWDFISVLVFDAFEAAEPTWFGEMQPIFTQYGNLYPLMDRLIDLTDYDAIAANVQVLSFVFALPITDPNSMPVTRDLSAAKRAAILKWLNTPGPDGKPLKGTEAPQPEAAAKRHVPTTEAVTSELHAIKSGLRKES
ncbi:MAG TPA: hypothetical protein VEO54_29715 [Thermoanaerobaculia bacterium]|nr:hypothetical protein [Thermoanaerobaculia bacterium]